MTREALRDACTCLALLRSRIVRLIHQAMQCRFGGSMPSGAVATFLAYKQSATLFWRNLAASSSLFLLATVNLSSPSVTISSQTPALNAIAF